MRKCPKVRLHYVKSKAKVTSLAYRFLGFSVLNTRMQTWNIFSSSLIANEWFTQKEIERQRKSKVIVSFDVRCHHCCELMVILGMHAYVSDKLSPLLVFGVKSLLTALEDDSHFIPTSADLHGHWMEIWVFFFYIGRFTWPLNWMDCPISRGFVVRLQTCLDSTINSSSKLLLGAGHWFYNASTFAYSFPRLHFSTVHSCLAAILVCFNGLQFHSYAHHVFLMHQTELHLVVVFFIGGGEKKSYRQDERAGVG